MENVLNKKTKKDFRKIKLEDKTIYIDLSDLDTKDKYLGGVINEDIEYSGYIIKEKNYVAPQSIFGTYMAAMGLRGLLEIMKKILSVKAFQTLLIISPIIILLYYKFKKMYIYNSLGRKVKENLVQKVKIKTKDISINHNKKNSGNDKFSSLLVVAIIILLYSIVAMDYIMLFFCTYIILHLPFASKYASPNHLYTKYIIDNIRVATSDDLVYVKDPLITRIKGNVKENKIAYSVLIIILMFIISMIAYTNYSYSNSNTTGIYDISEKETASNLLNSEDYDIGRNFEADFREKSKSEADVYTLLYNKSFTNNKSEVIIFIDTKENLSDRDVVNVLNSLYAVINNKPGYKNSEFKIQIDGKKFSKTFKLKRLEYLDNIKNIKDLHKIYNDNIER